MNKPKGWRGNRFGHSLASKGVKTSRMNAKGQTQTLGTHRTAFNIKNGVLSVIYHQTEVVKANLNKGIVVLDSGGYLTNTTKTRMNQASNQFDLGYRVVQKNFEWFIQLENGKVLKFKDNLKFSPRRALNSAGILDATARLTARKLKLIGKKVEKNAKITAEKIKVLEKDIKRRADEVEKKIEAL